MLPLNSVQVAAIKSAKILVSLLQSEAKKEVWTSLPLMLATPLVPEAMTFNSLTLAPSTPTANT
jgi:hypothetical protein